MRKLEQMEWWPELVEKKDDYSLRELADMFGATPGAINNALKRNGIKRTPAPPGPRSRRGRSTPKKAAESAPKRSRGSKKSAAAAAPAPVAAAPAAAAAPAPRGRAANTARKIEPYVDMLGTVPDSEIASLAGLSAQTVARFRRDRGVDAFRGRGGDKAEVVEVTEAAAPAPAEESGGGKRGGRSKVAPFADQLGVLSDAEIADKAGVTVNAVRNYRNRKGIPAPSRAAEPEVEEAPTPVVEAAPAAEPVVEAAPAVEAAPVAEIRGGFAFRVQIKGGDAAVVVGAGMVEAAQKAIGAGVEITAIELIGRVIA